MLLQEIGGRLEITIPDLGYNLRFCEITDHFRPHADGIFAVPSKVIILFEPPIITPTRPNH